MMAVRITVDPPFTAGSPEMLFRGPYVNLAGPRSAAFDLARDGRFLMLKPVETEQKDTAPPELVVVLDWFEEFKRLVPTN